MDSIEAIGLVKMDVLAQGGLAVMRDVQQMLARNSKRVERGHSCPIPLGIGPYPGGIVDNSPTFKRWVQAKSRRAG